MLITMLKMSCMVESIVCHESEQITNSEECSELDTTSAAMVFTIVMIILLQ